MAKIIKEKTKLTAILSTSLRSMNEKRVQTDRNVHLSILSKLGDKAHELEGFLHDLVRIYRKVHIKNRIRRSYEQRILKNLKSFRKTRIVKRLSMVIFNLPYKDSRESCFFGTVFSISSFGVASLSNFFSTFFSPLLLVGLSKDSTNEDKKRTQKPSKKCGKNKNGSCKKKKRVNKISNEKATGTYLKSIFPQIKKIITIRRAGPVVVAYIRVSSWGQVIDGKSLQFQEKELIRSAKQIGASRIIVISDEGKTGKDFSNRNLGIILRLAVAGKINKLLASGVDRIGRNAFEFMHFVFQIRRLGVTLVIHNDKEYDVTKLVDLVILAVKAAGAEDQNNHRGYYSLRTKVGNFQKREWNRPIPWGYKRKGTWITKAFGWKRIIHDIFTLFLICKSYRGVCMKINEDYGAFLKSNRKEPLQGEQAKKILEDTIYVGYPKSSGEATQEKFGDVIVEDPSLAYVSEATFKKAQAIIKKIGKKYESRKKHVEELVETCGLDSLECLPNVGIFCPNCKSEMNGNGYGGYICSNPKCKTQFNGLKKSVLEKLRDWALVRESALELLIKLSKKFKWTGAADKKWKKIERLLKKFMSEKSGGSEEEETDNVDED